MTGRTPARVGLGFWFTPCRENGLDINYFFLGNSIARLDATDATYPILRGPSST